METKRTNKETLAKGLKTMAISLILMFAGPTLVYVVLTNKEKPFFIPLIIIAIAICGLAIYFAFKGIQIILDSMFKNN